MKSMEKHFTYSPTSMKSNKKKQHCWSKHRNNKTVLMIKGAARLYIVFLFIASSYWLKVELSNCNGRFLQGIRALEPSLFAACEGSNPEICGCGSVYQADYRGSINSTKSGYKCSRWDEDASMSQNHPNAGLDENYCRNPDEFKSLGPWCYTNDLDAVDGWEYCDIPFCEDSLPSAHPSMSIQPFSSSLPTGDEQNALKKFYDSTNGNGWLDNANWLSEYTDFCNWYGIQCNEVVMLLISICQIMGFRVSSLRTYLPCHILKYLTLAIIISG